MYEFLADAVVTVHFMWVLFLIFGAFWGRRNHIVKYVHIAGLILAFLVETCDWYCPLTDLEVWLRSMQGYGHVYSGSFLVHYLEELLYVPAPRYLIVMVTIALVAINFWLYRKRR